MSTPDPKRELLRHTLATLAYRGAVRNAPEEFGSYQGAKKTPLEIPAHIGDLLDWGLAMANGKHPREQCGRHLRRQWHDSTPLPSNQEVNRFFAGLDRFDEYLASAEALESSVERLFQGPIADALTRVGQIARLRRLAAVPIKGENYFAAD